MTVDEQRPPKVSVIIPTFNRAMSLVAAVESVRAQTEQDVEIIVVDDASTDATVAFAERIALLEPRMRVIRQPRNTGAQAARNRGVSEARSPWVAFLDSDDTYLPSSVESRLRAATTAGVSVAHSECLVARESDEPVPFGTPPLQGNVLRAVLAAPGPTFPALIVTKDLLAAVGGLDESIVAFQEWDTAIRLATRSGFAFVPEPTFIWNQRGADTISKDARRTALGYEQVIRKHARLIARIAGLDSLSGHLLECGRLRMAAGDRGAAYVRIGLAILVWPWKARRTWRAARAMRSARLVETRRGRR